LPENTVGAHIAILGVESRFPIPSLPPSKPFVHQSLNTSLLQLEDITEEAAAKALTTFFMYTITPKGGWHAVDVTRENVKEEDLRSQVKRVDVQRAKLKLKQHKRRQVDQLMAALNSQESNRSFQWYCSAIIPEGKSLAVIVERGPKAGLQASVVYKAAMIAPTSFAPRPPQVNSAPSRPQVPGACSVNTVERSGCHIIILTYEGALGWVGNE
jgi:hypothetical protein